jgi:hypothetical protein
MLHLERLQDRNLPMRAALFSPRKLCLSFSKPLILIVSVTKQGKGALDFLDSDIAKGSMI